MLLFALVNDISGDEVTCWNNNHVNYIRMCKKNICTDRSSYYGSSGYYASFGMKANCGILDKSSLAEYTVKKQG